MNKIHHYIAYLLISDRLLTVQKVHIFEVMGKKKERKKKNHETY